MARGTNQLRSHIRGLLAQRHRVYSLKVVLVISFQGSLFPIIPFKCVPLYVYRIDRVILWSRKLRPIRLNSEKRVVLEYVSN